MPLHQIRATHQPAHQVPQVHLEEVRRQYAACQPVEVQEVGNDPVELSGVLRDPRGDVPSLVHVQVEIVALQRQRQPQDRGQRCSQVVGDGLEERVLHLVGGAELFGQVSLASQIALELLRAPHMGDVDHRPLPVLRVALVVGDQMRLVVHPDEAAVGRAYAIDGIDRSIGGDESARTLIVGMDDLVS